MRGKLSLSRIGTARNARHTQMDEVQESRRKVFGYQSGMPGEGQFLKPLKGKETMRWAHPSRYMMQDFRVDQYVEMQARRFAPVEKSPVIEKLSATLMKIIADRKIIQSFFATVDEAAFNESPSLQDLYGLYRTILPSDNPLGFTPRPEVWQPSGFSWLDSMDLLRARRMMESLLESQPEKLFAFNKSWDTCLEQEEKRALLQTTLEEVSVRGEDDSWFDFVASTVPSPVQDADFVVATRGNDLEGDPESLTIPKFYLTDEDMGIERERKTPEQIEEERRARLAQTLLEQKLETELAAKEAAKEREKRAAAGEEGLFEEEEGDILLYKGITASFEYPPEASAQQVAALETARKEGQAAMEELLKEDPALMELWTRRHRYMEPQFERRRNSYLDRLQKDRIKESRKHFANLRWTIHPDLQKTWPSAKGNIAAPFFSPFN